MLNKVCIKDGIGLVNIVRKAEHVDVLKAIGGVHKQVYIYGGLDRSPTMLNRKFGMAWGVGGWLLTPFLQRVGPEVVKKLRERVAAEIKTTFASKFHTEVSL